MANKRLGAVLATIQADQRKRDEEALASPSVFEVQVACFALLFADFGLSVSSATLLVSGIASGGLLPVMSHLFADRFGAVNLGRSMGLANLAILPFGFGLPMIAGGLRDATESYSTTIMLCMGLLLVGLAAVTMLARIDRAFTR